MKIEDAILKRYPSPEWVTCFEVRNGTGAESRRAADAVAINTWPSRGLSIHGIEVKKQRTDWLRELKNPEKSEPVQQFCNYWWLATTDDKVAKLDEIPLMWGWLVLQGTKLEVVKAAPELDTNPPTIGFIASLIRNLQSDMVHKSTIDGLVEERVRIGIEQNKSYEEHRKTQLLREAEEVRARVDAFEKASGISLAGQWCDARGAVDGAKLGSIVQSILAFSDDRYNSLGASITSLKSALQQLEYLSAGLKRFLPGGEL